jgi:hypothetical protein
VLNDTRWDRGKWFGGETGKRRRLKYMLEDRAAFALGLQVRLPYSTALHIKNVKKDLGWE